MGITAMGPIDRALRKAIAAQKESRYATAKRSGVPYPTLTRFLDEHADIRLSTVEALSVYLNLELAPKKK
jgi:hypothetical protein